MIDEQRGRERRDECECDRGTDERGRLGLDVVSRGKASGGCQYRYTYLCGACGVLDRAQGDHMDPALSEEIV